METIHTLEKIFFKIFKALFDIFIALLAVSQYLSKQLICLPI